MKNLLGIAKKILQLSAIVLVLFCGIIVTSTWPEWFSNIVNHLKGGAPKGTIANYIIYRNIGLFLAGFIGVFLAFWRSKSLSRQATVAEQGHITERIIRASEQLGSPEIHVRIGAIYTLWRTATDTNLEADKVMILDMLCAYVRSPTENYVNENSLILEKKYGKLHKKITDEKIREDVQVCLNLLSKHIHELDLASKYNLNLQNSFLKQSDLVGALLVGASLRGANLVETNLSKADLREADFSGADLSRANLVSADLSKAKLFETDLREANLVGAKLHGAYLIKANFCGAYPSVEHISMKLIS